VSQKTRDWDAATYDRVSTPQVIWATEVLDRLPLKGDETVLDAGCGSGRVTKMLDDRLPDGHVIAVDASPSMVEKAREALRPDAEVFVCELTDLDVHERADAVFSNAVFHWIPDHDALFAALYRNLKPGGRLLAQCGGRGNIDAFRRTAEEVAGEPPFAEFFAGWVKPWNYATAEETAARLTRAGFSEVRTWLEPKRVLPERDFVRTVCLVRHLDPLPVDLRDPFVDRVIERCGEPVALDYVRLNMMARRS
jgi:trans-aconitate 2-methyltransferase